MEAILYRLTEIYQNFVQSLQPSKMTLQIGEVIFCDILGNFYGTTKCQSQMKYSQVSKSKSLLCSCMSSTCLQPLHWDRGGTVVKVLCYKSEGRWFDSRWRH
jgi:hypothetical protein